MAMRSRGWYFDGSKFINIDNLAFNTIFSFEVWVRATTGGSLLKIGETYMDMGISGSLKPYVSTNENTYSADSEIQGTWTHIAFEINLLTVSIYRNGV